MIEELRCHGDDLCPVTLYPMLHGLERARYLSREERLVGEVVDGQGPASLPDADAATRTQLA